VELPEGMAKALEGKIIVVDTPRGAKARPNTRDTYECWIKRHHPKEGSTLLAVSYPLLWVYQQMTAETILQGKYGVDTVAPAVPHDDNYKYRFVSIVFDTIAKCLYEIHEQNKAKASSQGTLSQQATQGRNLSSEEKSLGFFDRVALVMNCWNFVSRII
jgi:hypothetical protein